MDEEPSCSGLLVNPSVLWTKRHHDWVVSRITSRPEFPQVAQLVVTDNYASRYGSDRHRVRGAYLHGPVDG